MTKHILFIAVFALLVAIVAVYQSGCTNPVSEPTAMKVGTLPGNPMAIDGRDWLLFLYPKTVPINVQVWDKWHATWCDCDWEYTSTRAYVKIDNKSANNSWIRPGMQYRILYMGE